jgi:hypothetical protein
MSTLHKIDHIMLNPKRPPSHALIMRMAGVSLAAGYKAIDIRWNNEGIELTFSDNAGIWYGIGSINQESGTRIARELNEIRQFVLDHFQIITIGNLKHV